VSAHQCCCDDGGGGPTYGNCDKVPCTDYLTEYCFEVAGWKWLHMYVRYATVNIFGTSHYDANGVAIPHNTPVFWYVVSGTFDVTGSVDVAGFDGYRTVSLPGGNSPNGCTSAGANFGPCLEPGQVVSAPWPRWFSGRTGGVYTTSAGTQRYSWSSTAADGQTLQELCDFDVCNPLGATVSYSGTANYKFEVLTPYRRGSPSAPLVGTVTDTQSQSVEWPALAYSNCVALNGGAGLQLLFNLYPYLYGIPPWCTAPEDFAWSDAAVPDSSLDSGFGSPAYTFSTMLDGAPSEDAMGWFHAPIGGGTITPMPVSCSCPGGTKLYDWTGSWSGTPPTTPPASAAAAFATYPNGLNASGSGGSFARVYAFNTPSITHGPCVP